MPVMITLDSGRTVDAAIPENATLVADTIDKLRASITTAEQDATAAEAAAAKATATADELREQLDAERAKTTDAALQARISAITATRDAARKIAGAEFTCDSMDIMTIKREALKVAKPTTDWADKADMYVEARFDAAIESADAAPADNGQLRKLAADGATIVKPTDDKAPQSAYQKFKETQASAWKGE